MRREHNDHFDPTKPALVVLYGATKRKCRPLVNDVTVLGRGPGCDIGLVSPEVAPVHCVIVRLGDCWRIRDCSGRATRVNGRAIEDEPLSNGDVIQIGTFSFETHLPTQTSPSVPAATRASPASDEVALGGVSPLVDDRRVPRLQASRRRLVDLALNMRRKLREAREEASDLARREQDLAQLECRLRAAHSAKPNAQPDAQTLQTLQALQAEQGLLERRKRELDNFAAHLRRIKAKMHLQERAQAEQLEADRAGYEADLIQAQREVERDRRDLGDLRRHVEQRHVELEQTAALLEEELSREKEELESDREQLARERAYMDQQRQEVVQLRTELERRHAEQTRSAPIAPLSPNDTHLDASPDRLAGARRLLRQLAERRKTLGETPANVATE